MQAWMQTLSQNHLRILMRTSFLRLIANVLHLSCKHLHPMQRLPKRQMISTCSRRSWWRCSVFDFRFLFA